MDDFLFIRTVYFSLFFLVITLTILVVELVSRVVSKLKFYLQRRKERIMGWAFTLRSG